MATQEELTKEILESKIGRYEIVKRALEWISVKKYDEDYRKLTHQDLISKAIEDVVEGRVTPEAIEELRNKYKARLSAAEKHPENSGGENKGKTQSKELDGKNQESKEIE
ncbi:MAG: hypothetical protein LBQ37_02330 [Elusimicrobiota bacterium]|jgi:hypothetical protein|nr:hypothetical protein [Elusimicrobiota bacterium]